MISCSHLWHLPLHGSVAFWETAVTALRSGLTQPRYPSELYEGLFALLIFGSLLWLSQRRPAKGTIFLVFLVVYPYGRAAIDITRINFGGHYGAPDLFLSIGIALVAELVFWLTRNRRNKVSSYIFDTGERQSEVLI